VPTGSLPATARHFAPRARQQNCQLFVEDMKMRIDHRSDSGFHYPDLPELLHPPQASVIAWAIRLDGVK